MAKSNAKVNVSRINRIKVVLVEQNKNWKMDYLSNYNVMKLQFPRWCSNASQPSLEMLVKIADILKVDVRQLINGINEK